MAINFWNFRPTDEQQKAAFMARQRADMQGYAPAPDMQGYQPTFGERQVNPGFVPATQPQLQQYQEHTDYDNSIQALQDEYDRNTARIAEIEKELRTLAVSDRKAVDELDLALAQNRAGIGDLGNAQMHLNRIDQRRAVDLGKTGNTAKDRVAAEDEIDRLYMMRAEGSPGQQAYYDRAIARKEAEYRRLYGKPYGGELQIPTGRQGVGVTSFAGWDDLYEQELVKNGKNGRLAQERIDYLQKELEGLPMGAERQARQEKLDAVKSNEKHAENVAKQKKAEKEAIDEVKKSVTGWDLKETGASKSVTAKNGKTVTVTRMSDGSVQYKCGSTKG